VRVFYGAIRPDLHADRQLVIAESSYEAQREFTAPPTP